MTESIFWRSGWGIQILNTILDINVPKRLAEKSSGNFKPFHFLIKRKNMKYGESMNIWNNLFLNHFQSLFHFNWSFSDVFRKYRSGALAKHELSVVYFWAKFVVAIFQKKNKIKKTHKEITWMWGSQWRMFFILKKPDTFFEWIFVIMNHCLQWCNWKIKRSKFIVFNF